MKKTKISAMMMAALITLSGCGAGTMNNTTKGGLIGGGGGAAVGALLGNIIGGSNHRTGGTLIGAAVGAAVGTGAGVLIGKKMDKAKAAAQAAVADAQVESVKDQNGLDAVKITLPSGILFATGKSTLSKDAMENLTKFTNDVLKVYADCDVAIQGYTDNQGFKNSTPEESIQKNIALSQQRADAVKSYILAQGAGASQVKSSIGYGENDPVADNATEAGRSQNRRVEIYLYASEAMIQAAESGSLQ